MVAERLEGTEQLSRRHLLAPAGGGRDRLVSGADAVGVIDGHHAPAGDPTGEGDDAVGGCSYMCTGREGEIDAAVTCRPAFRRRGEWTDDLAAIAGRPLVLDHLG